MSANPSLLATIDCHTAVIDAVAAQAVEPALEAFDELIGFVQRMLDDIEREVDPALLDSSVEPLPGPDRGREDGPGHGYFTSELMKAFSSGVCGSTKSVFEGPVSALGPGAYRRSRSRPAARSPSRA